MALRKSYKPTARFTVLASRRSGLDSSEFDIQLAEGRPEPFDVINFTERGTVWEFVVTSIRESATMLTLVCFNWLPGDGAFIGSEWVTRPMKAVEKRRYAKHLPIA